MKYSFIVPVYGCEEYLAECVQSILNQKGDHDFEVILVDDGSKDRSGQIADELARKDPRVRTFHKENGGAASARNYGLQKVCGDYILFIDGDDTIEDALLQTVETVLKRNPDTLVLYGMSFDYYRKNELIYTQTLSCAHSGRITIPELFSEYENFFYDNAMSSACNKVFSASVIRRHSLQMNEDMTLYEDYDFVLRYMMHVETVTCLAHPFYHYRNDLQTVHLDNRVRNLEKLKGNMLQLIQSAFTLAPDSIQLKTVTVNLYMLLLWKHLCINRYSVSELAACTTAYCAEPAFRSMLAEAVSIGKFEENLLLQIENKEFRELFRDLQKRNIKVRTKECIKKCLNALGMKRR